MSGGNIDARMLASVLLRALARSGRLVRLRIEVPDRPGVLASVAQIVGGLRANIVDVEHRRDLPGVALKSVRLDLSVEDARPSARRRDREGARGERIPRRGRLTRSAKKRGAMGVNGARGGRPLDGIASEG